MKIVVEKKYEGLMLKEFLPYFDVSKKALKAIKSKGKIKVNGELVNVLRKLNDQDVVEIIFPVEESQIVATPMVLDIYYEDDDYIILNKPAGLAVLPTKRHYGQSLSNGLMAYYQKNNIQATIHLVNRLDRDTTGLMIVAKNRYSHALLSKDIKQVSRIYHALVEGEIKKSGTVDAAILSVSGQYQRVIDIDGKNAITHYKPLHYDGKNTLVECILETGRTHQIRLHMKTLGHPLVSDKAYGANDVGQYYLDSVQVSFFHPIQKKLLIIKKNKKVD